MTIKDLLRADVRSPLEAIAAIKRPAISPDLLGDEEERYDADTHERAADDQPTLTELVEQGDLPNAILQLAERVGAIEAEALYAADSGAHDDDDALGIEERMLALAWMLWRQDGQHSPSAAKMMAQAFSHAHERKACLWALECAMASTADDLIHAAIKRLHEDRQRQPLSDFEQAVLEAEQRAQRVADAAQARYEDALDDHDGEA